MRKPIFIKGLVILLCILLHNFLYAQCYGPTATGVYTNGKKPSTSSNYFVNHIFSTFASTASGALNGNSIIIATSGGPTTNNIVSALTPGETLVTGTGFPSPAPAMHRISANNTSIKVTHTFTANLAAGTHLFLQDVDRMEGLTIVFKDASGTVVDPSNFTPFNMSTVNYPATYTPTITNVLFKATVTTDRSEPLVGIVIKSALVRSIEFSVTTISSTASNIEFFYSVPLTPSFTGTASSNSAVCSGNTLTLTNGTSALASTVPIPVNYTWGGPNSYANTTTSTTSSISSVTTAAAGTYSLTVQDAFGCFTSPALTTAVTINASPVLSLSSNSPVNYSNSINLSSNITSGTAPYTLAWTGPNSFTSAFQNPVVSSVTSANAGVYKMQVSDNNGCTASGTTYVAVKSGWIYIHDKNINEESSVNFTFSLKDNAGNLLKTFYTNDSAGNTLNIYDIGAGHDDGAGTLWAVAGVTTGTSNTGTVYYRLSGANTWVATNVTTATAIDGAALNQFVYINSSGNAYYYNAGVSTLIFNHSTSHNGQTANASDIAYGGGKIALRNTNGRVYLYTGDYTNDSWADISANTNIASRIDISSDGAMLVYILSATVKTYNISTAITTTLPAFTATSGAGASGTLDIGIDDNNTIYATGNTGNTTCCGNTDIVYSYPSGASSWTDEPEARGVKRITGGPGGQAWGSVNLGSTFSQTIYTRVTDETGIHLWLDDERIKNASSMYGNSIMMEVDAATYRVTETLPDATWDLGRYNIYDPTGNTTGNVTTNTTAVKPAYGEVVHVEYINEKLNPKLIDNGNCNTSILQSFDAGIGTGQFGNGNFGTPLEGTAYHYFSITSPQDGYYSLVKTSDGYWFSAPSVTDHTGNNGYFFMVNASYAKDEFYRQRITGLTASLTYRIQFYVANLSISNPIKPKIRFGMQTLAGTIFGDSTTPEVSGNAWQLFSVSFTVPSGVTTADLFLRNENIGGSGNDLAIDDISINPIPTPLDVNEISPAILSNLCVGSTYAISNTVGGGTWSISDTSVASVDSSGNITIHSIGAAGITYTYINNIFCVSTATSNVTISVPPTVNASPDFSNVCKNGTTVLNSNASSGTAPYNYLWSGSSGSISSVTDANPTLTAPSVAGSYNYSVKVTDSVGCTSPLTTTSITVHAPVSSIYVTCLDGHYPLPQIMEIGGSQGVSWLWSASDSNALFFTTSTATGAANTSTFQSPYISEPSNYKVVVTDSYGCQDSSTLIFSYSMCGIILPVSLVNFTIAKSNEDVLLKWTTTAEVNSKYFEIERSPDEKNWTKIGIVSATGGNVNNYLFTDTTPFAGINSYRLKIVDADGKYNYSIIRQLIINSNWKLTMYPNPVTSGLMLLKSNMQVTGVRIMDIRGNILFNKYNSFSTDVCKINIAQFNTGFYFIEVTNNQHQGYRSRFIKK